MIKENFLVRVLRWGVCLAPLSVLLYKHKTVHPFTTLKSLSFFTIIEILFILWLVLILFYPQYRLKFKLPDILLSVFLGSVIISALLGVSIGRSFWSTPDRLMGIFGILHFFGFFLILRSILFTKEQWKKYLYFLIGVSGIVSILAIVEKISPQLFLVQTNGRLGSTIGNPAFLAAYLLFNILIGIWLISEEKITSKQALLFLWPILILNIVVLGLANTRGAILGFLVAIFVLLAFFAWNRREGPFIKNIPLVLLVLAMVFVAIFISTKSSDVWQKIPGADRLASISIKDGATGNRLIAWGIAIEIFKERPVLGWGLENFKYGHDKRYDPTLFRGGFSESHWDKPHNIFLEYLVTGGITGLLAYLAFLISLFYVIIKKTKKGFVPFGLAILVGYLVQNCFVFDTFSSYLMFFIFLAFVSRISNGDEKEYQVAKVNIFKIGSLVVVILVIISLIFINIQIYRANVKQYHGMNYYINSLPCKAIESYKEGIAIKQPYQNSIRQSFFVSTKQMTRQLDIPNVEDVINLVLEEFDKVIMADPNNYFLYAALADARTAFYVTNPVFLNGAEEALQKAMELSSNRQQNLYVSSKIKYLRGDKQGSIEEMKKAIDLDFNIGDPHFFYGLLLFQIGEDKKGLEEIEIAESLGRYPKGVHERSMVANYYGDAGNYEKAAGLYRGVVESDPGNMEYKLKFAIILMYIDYYAEAKPLFEEVLRTVPEFRNNPNYQLIKPMLNQLGIE